MTDSPTQQDLIDAACWFDTDKAGGREMTSFKREARWRQHRWAVDALSIHSFGSHTARQRHADLPAEDIPNGTKLLDADAESGANFLSKEIYRVAQARVVEKQKHQTLDSRRLFRDLLSSMSMAFNLFGEASLADSASARHRLADLFGVRGTEPSDIVFEWSPGRQDPSYTRDGTAFDVALRFGSEGGPRTVIGIETKYHEHAIKELSPSDSKPIAKQRFIEQTELLAEIADGSGVFRPGWRDEILGTDLRQIWRDHLLALSMRAHPSLWSAETRHVLLYPSRNVNFADAARRYADVLVDDSTFRAATIDQVVDAAFADDSPTKEKFVRRYLWWME